jgi:hypothetical protein
MTARFVVRLLGADYGLLGWAEVMASARPQATGASCPFWPAGPTVLTIEADGLATYVTVHWSDLDVHRIQTLTQAVPVVAGRVVTLPWAEPIWLVPGMRDVPVPPVTVRQPVCVSVPVGSLNAVME